MILWYFYFCCIVCIICLVHISQFMYIYPGLNARSAHYQLLGLLLTLHRNMSGGKARGICRKNERLTASQRYNCFSNRPQLPYKFWRLALHKNLSGIHMIKIKRYHWVKLIRGKTIWNFHFIFTPCLHQSYHINVFTGTSHGRICLPQVNSENITFDRVKYSWQNFINSDTGYVRTLHGWNTAKPA